MDNNDLELVGLLLEDEEKQNVSMDQDSMDIDSTISERWASWVNIINR